MPLLSLSTLYLIAKSYRHVSEVARTYQILLLRNYVLRTIFCEFPPQATSTVIKKRFPTYDHFVEAGVMTEDERIELEQTVTPHGNWYLLLYLSCLQSLLLVLYYC